MAIVINGSGTVTGISVGGLPDGVVDAGTVAADVATQAELDAAGVGGATGVDFNDGVKARFGTGDDLELYHSGSHAYLTNATNDLIVENTTNDAAIILKSNNILIKDETNQKFIEGIENTGAVHLFHGGNKVLETRNGGIKVSSAVLEDTMFIEMTEDNMNARVLTVHCARDATDYTLYQGRNGGGEVFRVESGGAVKNSGNSYGSLSDERVKQDIADASSQWDDIKALKIRKYKLKKTVNRDGADNTPYYIGVVAQELESAGMNNLVDEQKPEKEDVALHADFGTIDGEGIFTEGEKKKEVKYSVLYMKAIKALQEAMDRIETLETKVTALEA
jgi:hypothetical protein